MADAVEKRRDESTSTSVVQPRSAYSKRFMLANLLVVVGFLGVLVVFGFLVSKESSKQAWSEYTPRATTSSRRLRTWSTTSPKYRFGGRRSPSSRHSRSSTATLSWTASPSPGRRCVRWAAASRLRARGSTIAYVFCGQAQRCALPQAGAGEIGPLLRRESLELALYTFKYWPDVRSIGLGKPGGLVERRGLPQAAPLGEVPRQAAPSHAPPHEELTAESLTSAERETIDRVVVNNTFLSRFEQAPNGRTVLLLTAVNQ